MDRDLEAPAAQEDAAAAAAAAREDWKRHKKGSKSSILRHFKTFYRNSSKNSLRILLHFFLPNPSTALSKESFPGPECHERSEGQGEVQVQSKA